MVRDDDDEKPGENGGSTRATSVETNSGPATPHDPPSPETQARLSICSPHPAIKPMDRLTSPSAALLQQPCIRDGGEDGGIAAVVADLSSASPSLLFQHSPAATSMLEGGLGDPKDCQHKTGRKRISVSGTVEGYMAAQERIRKRPAAAEGV